MNSFVDGDGGRKCIKIRNFQALFDNSNEVENNHVMTSLEAQISKNSIPYGSTISKNSFGDSKESSCLPNVMTLSMKI